MLSVPSNVFVGKRAALASPLQKLNSNSPVEPDDTKEPVSVSLYQLLPTSVIVAVALEPTVPNVPVDRL